MPLYELRFLESIDFLPSLRTINSTAINLFIKKVILDIKTQYSVYTVFIFDNLQFGRVTINERNSTCQYVLVF